MTGRRLFLEDIIWQLRDANTHLHHFYESSTLSSLLLFRVGMLEFRMNRLIDEKYLQNKMHSG